MPGDSKTKTIYPRADIFAVGVYRIIDANINRLKEGLRVCEEITRFIMNNYNLTHKFKGIRHRADTLLKRLSIHMELLKGRESLKDVGRNVSLKEMERRNYQDIFFANIQRAKESARVLEEFIKLINKNIALEFKKMRYGIYELEKTTVKKISSLSYRR